MKAIVLGGTGFIGSHIAEQLILAKHQVTAVVRSSSNVNFLKSLGIPLVHVDFNDPDILTQAFEGYDVIYNCVSDVRRIQSLEAYRKVNVDLTRKITKAASDAKIRRFLQLSTVQVYGLSMPPEFIDETYPCKPEFPFQQASLERERTVQEVAAKTGLDTVILRPANTIGARDTKSFFSILYRAHLKNKYPIIQGGKARWSCVDTRDIGRAMVWLGELGSATGHTYLLKGFETSWLELKSEIDRACGVTAKVQNIPGWVAALVAALTERLTPSTKEPFVTRRAVRSMTTSYLYSDVALRKTGFNPLYNLQEAVVAALARPESGIITESTIGCSY